MYIFLSTRALLFRLKIGSEWNPADLTHAYRCVPHRAPQWPAVGSGSVQGRRGRAPVVWTTGAIIEPFCQIPLSSQASRILSFQVQTNLTFQLRQQKNLPPEDAFFRTRLQVLRQIGSADTSVVNASFGSERRCYVMIMNLR